jgi:hypothetical protein
MRPFYHPWIETLPSPLPLLSGFSRLWSEAAVLAKRKKSGSILPLRAPLRSPNKARPAMFLSLHSAGIRS